MYYYRTITIQQRYGSSENGKSSIALVFNRPIKTNKNTLQPLLCFNTLETAKSWSNNLSCTLPIHIILVSHTIAAKDVDKQHHIETMITVGGFLCGKSFKSTEISVSWF